MDKENSKVYPIIFNENRNVIILNEIIKGKQNMSLQEAKLLRLLIIQVVREDKDFKTYIIKIKDLAKYLNVSNSNLYRDVKNICDLLMSRIVKIHTNNPKNPWKTIQWLQLAEYDGKGTLKLMLSNQMQPYILDLCSWFTKYPIKYVLSMNSFYSIRIYELLRMRNNINRNYKEQDISNIELKLDLLKQILDCENKFKQIGQFKIKVLEVAVKEINQYTDMQVSYEYIKESRKVVGIKFITSNKENPKEQINDNKEEIKTISEIDVFELIEKVEDIIAEPIKTKDLKKILKAANNDIELIKEKYKAAKKQGGIENLVGWLISAINNNYSVSEPIAIEKEKTKKPYIKPNRFINYEQRDWDFKEMRKLERKILDREAGEIEN